MMRTACIRLKVTTEQAARLSALRTAYADACNRLVPLVQAARCWNRVALHQLGYRALRQQTSLGAQMACNAIFSVCKAYRSQGALGRIPQDTPVPPLSFDRTSVHFDHRTYTLKGEALSLNTRQGAAACQTRQSRNEQGDSRGSPTHWRGHDRHGGPHAHPRSPPHRPAYARQAPPLGVPAIAGLRRVQGPCHWDLRRVRQSGLQQPDLFGLRAVGYTAQASFRVFLWSPGAR